MKAKEFIFNPLFFYIILGIVALIVVGILDSSWLTWDSRKDVLVEFHGLLFDILFFGILFTIFSMISSKFNDIKKYKEKIDDLRGWNSEEATFKIIANLKRLLKLNAKNISLNECFLVESNLDNLTLENIQIDNSSAMKGNFKNSNLSNSSFKNSALNEAVFSYSNLSQSNFSYALLFNSFFEGANLTEACFENANIKKSHFEQVVLDKTWDDYEQKLNSIIAKSYIKEDDIEDGEKIRTKLIKSNFSYTILDGSNLESVNAKEANFNGASMLNLNLKNANLVKADLRNTNLSYSNLDGANLESAQFHNTLFIGAILTNIKFRKITFINCEIKDATFSNSQKNDLIKLGVNPDNVNWR